MRTGRDSVRSAFGAIGLFFFANCAFGVISPVSCPAGAPIGNIDLRVFTAGETAGLPLRTINHLGEGNRVVYRPILGRHEKRSGEVSLVLAPAVPESTNERLIVLEPKSAAERCEWTIPRRVSVVAFVYGPFGLNKSKVKTFLSQDDQLMNQLAQYAEKTAQVEGLIQALSNSQGSTENLDAALSGFASQYGWSTRIDHSLPSQQQALTILQTINPTLNNYDPLASQTMQHLGAAARLATSIAGLFLGSPVGLAAGGTAVALDMKGIVSPRLSFRSSFAATLPNGAFTLCGRLDSVPPHTKLAYIWALQIPNANAPRLSVGHANYLPAAEKSPLQISVSDADWVNLDRARNWELIDGKGNAKPLVVIKSGTDKTLTLNLPGSLTPGSYQLASDWDWDTFRANGQIFVRRLPDITTAHLTPYSQDHLITGSGNTPVTLHGTDFEFLTNVEIKKQHDEFAKPVALPFVLHAGLRGGPQENTDVLVDTDNLEPGPYDLFLTQVDGIAHSVPIEVLSKPPIIRNLPIVISHGEQKDCLILRGERLNLLTKLDSPEARIELSPAVPNGNERSATLYMNAQLPAGTLYDIKARISGHVEPVTLPNAIRIVGPRPEILDVRLSPPAEMDVELKPDEFPTGVFVNALLHVRNVEQDSTVEVSCLGQKLPPMVIHMGDHSAITSLQQINPDHMFIAFDSGGWASGCQMLAVVNNGIDGKSDSFRLGQLVRMPQIEEFKILAKRGSDNFLDATLRGTDLQAIDKVGWEPSTSIPVTDLPAPIPQQGLKQTLHVRLPTPQPSPHSHLYIWLRGETVGRLTSFHE